MKVNHFRPRLVASLLLFLATLSVLLMSSASAATYYVNATTGSDTWTGTNAVPVSSPAVDGPWRSLAKVSATALLPGDSVLLSCGQTWYEPLTIASSGTAGNPITIGTYPSICTVPPSISGMVSIPSSSWSLYKNTIYKTQTSANLIQNGSFDTDLNWWWKYSSTRDTSLALQSCGGLPADRCMAVTTGASSGLVSSNIFTVKAANKYTLSLKVKAPAGLLVKLVVRRRVAPSEAAGLSTTISGTGAWVTYSFPFTATKSMDNARVDIEVPARKTNVLFNDIALTQSLVDVPQVFANGVGVNPAHHPNAGYKVTSPASVYLRMAANGNNVLQADGSYGSTYIVTGSDLVLPPGGSLISGLGVVVRIDPWTLISRKIASVVGSRINLDNATKAPAQAGFGYFLLGALWMLDSPGEWYFDAVSKTLYVQMPDNAPPGSRVTIGQGSYGISVDNRSNINISGLSIRGTDRGVSMANAQNISLTGMLVENILNHGVFAQGAHTATISNNTIRRTGLTGIYGWGGQNQTITGNTLSEIGVRVADGQVTSLPGSSPGGIAAGPAASVTGNRVQYIAYEGIRMETDGEASDNWVDSACMTLDDCGGIYNYGQNNTGLRIERNLVTNIPSTSSDGQPTTGTNTAGIYLDNHSSNVTVADNAVVGADYGVKVHDGAYNTISGNTVYGSRRYQLLFQDDSSVLDANGDTHDNTVLANYFVPTNANPSVKQLRMTVGNASRFADYDQNVYSTLLSSIVVDEGLLTNTKLYSFPLWQAATVDGSPRNLDPLGSTVAIRGFASYAIKPPGSNLVTNGNFTSGIADWIPYQGQTFPHNTCPSNAQCIQFTGLSATGGLLPSPRFSVLAGQYYRVSFDFKTGVNNQTFSSVVRRGGGGSNGYESLQGAPSPLLGSTSWKRHSYVFKASKTINKKDPVTLDEGARLDFQDVVTGQTIFIDNVEVVPVTAIGAPLKTNVLVNNTNALAALPCPDAVSAPAYCDQYVRFVDSTPIIWPHDVPPLSAEVIYTVDRTSLDSDSDGVSDTQDLCPSTAASMAANSKGCAIDQTPL